MEVTKSSYAFGFYLVNLYSDVISGPHTAEEAERLRLEDSLKGWDVEIVERQKDGSLRRVTGP